MATEKNKIESQSEKENEVSITIYEQLKLKATLSSLETIELSIEDQLNLIRLQTMAPLINMLYTASTGKGAEDFAMNTVFSEAMDKFMNNERDFARDIHQPYQSISQDDLMGIWSHVE
jgi:hypothetical protein